MIDSVFKYITGIVKLRGGTDNTIIGNTSDSLKVTITSIPSGALTDRSGTATAASTTLMSANTSRKYLFIYNPQAQAMWINFTSAATAATPSIKLSGGSSFVMEGSFISTEAITCIRDGGVNVAFTAKEG